MKLGVVVGMILLLALGLVAVFMGPTLLGMMQTREVLAHGVPAQARIIEMTDTGTRINDVPLIAVEVQVMPPAAPAYTAVFNQTLTFADADTFRISNVIAVKFDPQHPERVAAVPARP